MRAFAIAFAVGFAIAGCRTPTSVTLELSTDVDCSKANGTTITVGESGDVETKPPVASTRACAETGKDHPIGSLVVVPSGANDASFAVKIVEGVSTAAESCAPPDYKGCIVARRALTFIPHDELVLPIPLRGACEDVPCSPTTTCVLGKCVGAQINPNLCDDPGGCPETVLTGSGGGGTGGAGGAGGVGGGACNPSDPTPNQPGCTTYYKDADGDGHGVPSDSRCLCGPDATSGYTATVGDDCDDTCNVCWTGHAEVCDGFDNNCDGTRDPPGCCPQPTPSMSCTNGWCSIQPGCFVMGSPATELCRDPDEAQVEVTLTHGFTIGQHEVTQGEYQTLMGTNPSQFTTCGPNCPVERVSWHDAAAYCNALSASQGFPTCYVCAGNCGVAAAYSGAKIYSCPGYRLPTEAEWEYVARAGDTKATEAGDLTSCMDDPALYPYAWFATDASATHPVCALQKNPWGLCDMEGNVGEWMHEAYATHPTGPVTDPAVPDLTNKGFTKGGSWFDKPSEARFAARYSGAAISHYNTWGFRCIKTN